MIINADTQGGKGIEEKVNSKRHQFQIHISRIAKLTASRQEELKFQVSDLTNGPSSNASYETRDVGCDIQSTSVRVLRGALSFSNFNFWF